MYLWHYRKKWLSVTKIFLSAEGLLSSSTIPLVLLFQRFNDRFASANHAFATYHWKFKKSLQLQ